MLYIFIYLFLLLCICWCYLNIVYCRLLIWLQYLFNILYIDVRKHIFSYFIQKVCGGRLLFILYCDWLFIFIYFNVTVLYLLLLPYYNRVLLIWLQYLLNIFYNIVVEKSIVIFLFQKVSVGIIIVCMAFYIYLFYFYCFVPYYNLVGY